MGSRDREIGSVSAGIITLLGGKNVMLVARRSQSMNWKRKQNKLNWRESKLSERRGGRRLVEMIGGVEEISGIELEEIGEIIGIEIEGIVTGIEIGEIVIETEIEEIVTEIEIEEETGTGTEMTGPAHGTAEMEGEVEAKMTLQMLTLFLLPTTDVVEEIQMTDTETEIETATEILVIDLEIGTEIPRDLETEIATGKRRKAVKIRKEIKQR